MSREHEQLAEQLAYYRARAGEYDAWWRRQGRYDRGPTDNAAWFAEAAAVHAALDHAMPTTEWLELACGTGNWTRLLLSHGGAVDCVDAAPEMLAAHAARIDDPRVRRIEADLFAWRPARRYGGVFFGFWLSHVPPARFEAFWAMVAAALAPGGSAWFVDSLPDPASSARDHAPADPSSIVQRRRLDDGREFRVVKRYDDPSALTARLRELGWRAEVRAGGRFFLHGFAVPGVTRP